MNPLRWCDKGDWRTSGTAVIWFDDGKATSSCEGTPLGSKIGKKKNENEIISKKLYKTSYLILWRKKRTERSYFAYLLTLILYYCFKPILTQKSMLQCQYFIFTLFQLFSTENMTFSWFCPCKYLKKSQK